MSVGDDAPPETMGFCPPEEKPTAIHPALSSAVRVRLIEEETSAFHDKRK
jgi:hypothetical protein